MPDSFVIGQLYSVDGSCVAVIANDFLQAHITFVCGKDKKFCELSTLCVAMAFHPNNKLFFLLDEHNTIHCFDYKTKECIHTIHCKDQEKIPVRQLEKRLAISKSGKNMYAALFNKVVKIPLCFKIFFGENEKAELFAMSGLLQLYEYEKDGMILPYDVIQVIMHTAFKLYRKDALKNTN